MEYIPDQCAAQSIGPANNLLSTLITALFAAHCNISSPNLWPKDYGPRSLEDGYLDSYDFVIIGGGTAGSVVANRLSENPSHRILVLEAGGDPSIESQIPGLQSTNLLSPYDWSYETISNGVSCLGHENETCTYPKGRMLGGDSGIGTMLYSRGNRRDYDEWEKAGNPTWGWKHVLQFFKKSENFKEFTLSNEHGLGGPVSIESFRRSPRQVPNMIVRAARELGNKLVDDFIDDEYLGFGFLYGFLESGRRVNMASAFLNADRPNLHVIKNAVADKITFNRRKMADSVSFVYKDKHLMKVNVKKEVIVSAGAIETPKLLILSGVGPQIHLNGLGIPVVSDLRVGDNLQDHTRVDLYFKFEGKGDNADQKLETIDDIYYQWTRGNSTLASSMYDVTGFISADQYSRYPDVQYLFRVIHNITESTEHLQPKIRRSLEKQIKPGDRVFAIVVRFLKPESRGYVRAFSTNYEDPPLILANSFEKDNDVLATIYGIQEIMDLENTKTFRRVKGRFLKIDLPICGRYKYKTARYWSCYIKYISDSDHGYVGTAKMGPKSDPDSVVDPKLRVRGVHDIRVIDASIMPTIPSGSTMAATIMVAEKGAEFVKETWKQ